MKNKDCSFCENRYEALLQATPDIICEVDNERNYTWMNDAGLNFFGKGAIGKNVEDYLSSKRETYSNIQSRLQEKEQVFCVKSWHLRNDGQERLLAWWRRVLRGDNGEVTGTLYTGRDITERWHAEIEKDKLISDLQNRNKQFRCLFEFSKLVVKTGISLNSIVEGMLQLIVQTFQYPKKTACRVICSGEEFRSKRFFESDNTLEKTLNVNGKDSGVLQVFLKDSISFSKEESDLIETLSDSLSKTIERVWGEREIQKEKIKLEEANITLKNILSRVEEEKKSVKENIALNVEKNILPLLKEMRTGDSVNHSKLDLLEESVVSVSSDFHRRLIDLKYNLTPTEIEICKLIKSGYLGKTIAEMLNISYLTIESHKRNIRKKLKLNGTKTNLRTYLIELL